MKLLNLVARVSRAFTEGIETNLKTVQKVKDNQIRDVVTELDIRLHRITEQFMGERLPGCRLLSEEGDQGAADTCLLLDGEWLIVDPLDGSNNHALGLPNYGFMATHMTDGQFKGAAVVLPEYGQYLIWENGQMLFSQPLPQVQNSGSGPVYYGYPPKQDTAARKARIAVQELIDAQSAGMYRYGSACIGLYQLLCGKHAAFIGHGIRLWDALAFLPMLHLSGMEAQYNIKGTAMTIVAGRDHNFVSDVATIMKQHENISLRGYAPQGTLRIERP